MYPSMYVCVTLAYTEVKGQIGLLAIWTEHLAQLIVSGATYHNRYPNQPAPGQRLSDWRLLLCTVLYWDL